MKKEALLILLILFTLPLITAEKVCSNESVKLSWDQKEIEEGKAKTIKGVGIGLVNADEVSSFKKTLAEILVDAEFVSLSNETPTAEIELLSGTYKIGLINITSTEAIIDVDGSSETMKEGEFGRIKGLYTSITKLENSDINPKVEFLIGLEQLTLSSHESPSKKITLKEKNYLIELFSASDNNALINVYLCDTGEVLEKQKPVQAVFNESKNNKTQEANKTEINQTVASANNIEQNNTKETENKTKQLNETNQKNEQVAKQTLFRRFINWLKKLFD